MKYLTLLLIFINCLIFSSFVNANNNDTRTDFVNLSGNLDDNLKSVQYSSENLTVNNQTGVINNNNVNVNKSKSSSILKIVQKKLNQRNYNKNKSERNNERNEIDALLTYTTFFESKLDEDIQRYEEARKSLQGVFCKDHTKLFIDGLRQRQEWALKMYDSSAKQIEGYLWGTRYYFGDFDECINAETFAGDLSEPLFKGQYCLADIKHRSVSEPTSRSLALRTYKERREQNSTIHWAICMPSTCSYQDVTRFLSTLMNNTKEFNITLQKNLCSFKHEKPINTLDMIFGCIVLAFLLISILVTLFHTFCIYSNKDVKHDPSVFNEIVASFSILNNLKKIFTLKNTNEYNLDFVGGIRTISMMVIIVGHSLIFALFGPLNNEIFIEESMKNPIYAFVSNSQLLVETFLMLSGLLMAFMLLIELDKRNGRINFIFVYIGRYIRLTPSFIVIIGFYATWMIRTGDGPLWNYRMGLERERCLASWWANILYINNYIGTENLCMFQAWYLAADTQLFIIAPFIIYPLWKWAKWGRILLGISTVITIIIPFLTHLLQDLDPTIVVFPSELPDFQYHYYFLIGYIKTHNRASSYFMGLTMGYIIYRMQKSKINFNRILVASLWVLSIVIAFGSLCSIAVFYGYNGRPDAIVSASYYIGHRLLWSIALAWIILACVTNNGGIIQKFLSLPVWQPLAKLTYCAYLVNGYVVLYGPAVTRDPVTLNVYEMTIRSLSHLLLSFVLALMLCVLFESPIHGIERILLRLGKKNPSTETTTEAVQDAVC